MNRNKITLLLALIGNFIARTEAQVAAVDCTAAIAVCTNPNFSVVPSGSGNVDFTTSNLVSNPVNNPAGIVPPGGSGCLMAGELNPAWMIISIQTAGTLEFSMGAGSGPGAQSGCFDWIMWNLLPSTCSDIKNNLQAPVRCCWNTYCSGGTGLASASNLPLGAHQQDFGAPLTVNCGDKLILCFSNYSSLSTLVPLNFFGTAAVSCTTVSCTTSSNELKFPVSVSGNFICYPNPSEGNFFINSHEHEELLITDELGRTICKIELNLTNHFTHSVNNLENGIYFISGKKFREKIIVLK